MIFLSRSRTSPTPFLSCPYYIKPYVILIKFPDLFQKNPDIQTLHSTRQTYNPAKHPITSEQFDQWQAIQWRLIRLNPNCDKLLPKTIAPRQCLLTVGRWKKKNRDRIGGTEISPGPVDWVSRRWFGRFDEKWTGDRERNNCAGARCSLESRRNYCRRIYPATGGTDRCYQFIRGSQPTAARLMAF